MPNYVYTNNVPFAPNDPGVDQPKMQVNTNSTSGILNEDHYTFQSSNLDGWHRQLHFPLTTAHVIQPNDASIGFTTPGVARSNAAQGAHVNSAGTFLTSATKAFGNFSTIAIGSLPSAITFTNSNNVVSGTAAQAGPSVVYTINLEPNAIEGTSVTILITSSTNPLTFLNYTYALNTLTITVPILGSQVFINFHLLQA